MEAYRFLSKIVKLEGHVSSGETVEINTRDCLDYLTEKADPKKILEDPLIKSNKNLLWQMASTEAPVNLYDSSTWPTGADFTPIVDVVHATIVPHMCQNH